jgi:hypothetical protein
MAAARWAVGGYGSVSLGLARGGGLSMVKFENRAQTQTNTQLCAQEVWDEH